MTLCTLVTFREETISDVETLILTSDISKAAKDIVNRDELDVESKALEVRPIGSLMGKLRFVHGEQGGTDRKGWRVSKRELARFALAYGLATRNRHSENKSHNPNVTNVTEGHNVTHAAKNQRGECASCL